MEAPLFDWHGKDWLLLAVLAILGAATFFPGLGLYGILDPSDGLCTEAAREMLEKGDYLTPHLNYQPFLEKPILYYWMVLAVFKVMGVSELAGRLPAAICGLVTVLFFYPMCRFFIRQRAAFLASLILLATPLFAVLGHVALMDLPFCLFLTVACLSLLRSYSGGSGSWLWLGYAALGFAVLVRGPVSIAVVGAIFILFLLSIGKYETSKWLQWWWREIQLLKVIPGLILTLAIAAPWYVAEAVITGGAFIREFFISQNVGGMAGADSDHQPWWYYIAVFFGGFCPWSVTFVMTPKSWLSFWHRRALRFTRYHFVTFSLCWMLAVTIGFSFFATKLPAYILPAAPPVAILSGVILDQWIRLRSARVAQILSALLAIAIPVAASFVHSFMANAGTLPVFVQGAVWGGIAAGEIAMIIALICASRKAVSAAMRAVVTGALVCNMALIPALTLTYYLSTDSQLIDLLHLCRQANANLALYLRDSPSVNFYRRQSVFEIHSEEELQKFLASPQSPHYLLVTKDNAHRIKYRAGVTPVMEKSKWSLFAMRGRNEAEQKPAEQPVTPSEGSVSQDMPDGRTDASRSLPPGESTGASKSLPAGENAGGSESSPEKNTEDLISPEANPSNSESSSSSSSSSGWDNDRPKSSQPDVQPGAPRSSTPDGNAGQ